MVLDRAHRERGIGVLIHGGALGADYAAAAWARHNAVRAEVYAVSDAEWKKLGKKAGPLRNQRMIDEGKPDAGIAFPGGTGTADCVERMKAAGIPVWEIDDIPPVVMLQPEEAVEQKEETLEAIKEKHEAFHQVAKAAFIAHVPDGKRGKFEDYRKIINEHLIEPAPDPGCWGSLARDLKKDGWIVPTGEREPMQAEGSHGRPTDVYVKVTP